jgi:glycosyltransferase involved in cell wall biosynthesis
MIQHTVLIPQRNAHQRVAGLLPRLESVLGEMSGTYEVIVIDDGSPPPAQQSLRQLQSLHPCLRLLRLDRRAGSGAALTAGIAAARGQVIVAIDLHGRYSLDDVPRLIQRLSRADAVFGYRRAGYAARALRAVLQLPRRLARGLLVRDPRCLFWAARHEALEGLELSGGRYRLLPEIVALSGYRVGQLHVDQLPRDRTAGVEGPHGRMTVWSELPLVGRLGGRAHPVTVTELVRATRRTIDSKHLRIDPAPQPGVRGPAPTDVPRADDSGGRAA